MGNIYEELKAAQGRIRLPGSSRFRSDYNREIERLTLRIGRTVRDFETKDRKRLLRAAASPVRKEARLRARVRKGNRTTLIYQRRGPKRQMSNYTRNGSGKKNKEVVEPGKRGGKLSSTYVPGNLANSVSTLSFSGSPDVFVGAKFRSGGFGAGSRIGNADGWYADLAYGGRGEFRKQILLPAAKSALRASIEAMRKKAIKAFRDRAKSRGLDVN